MGWIPLKDTNAVRMLEKLSELQLKLTELVVKQKYNNLQGKLNMLREDKADSDDGPEPASN